VLASLGALRGLGRHRSKPNPGGRPPAGVPASVRGMGRRIAVLVSGGGTNLQALLDDPAIAPSIAVVLSDRPGVHALERAEGRGVETVVVEPSAYADREAYTVAVRDALLERDVEIAVN